jgi:integrase
MKALVKDVFEYAVIHQYIKRDDDYTSYIDISVREEKSSSNERQERIKPFTINEIKQIMNMNTLNAKYALLYIFTGCRPSELLKIDTSKIYIDVECEDDGNKEIVSYMITGSKTDAGRNRIIPIHNTIKPIIVELLNDHPDYLISKPKSNMNVWFYDEHFKPLMKELNLNKTTYACRHTFSTLAKQYKVDTFSRKRIMGHKSNDITDDIYTHTLINSLYKEIHKIKI